MATSSFDKDFTLKTKKEVNSFLDMLKNPPNSIIKIRRDMISPTMERRGVEKLKQLLSH